MPRAHFPMLGWAVLCLGLASLPDTLRPQPVELLNVTNTLWHYLEGDADQGTAWSQPGFDDSQWPTGTGLFGWETSSGTDYGVPGTLNGGGGGSRFNPELTPTSSGGPVTDYFRARFTWPEPTSNLVLQGTLYVDDAVVIHINGQEAYRYNMPDGLPLWDTPAVIWDPSGEPNIIDSIRLPGTNVLGTGAENLIAVELHQAGANSSDKVFGLTLLGGQPRHPPSPRNRRTPTFWRGGTFP